MGILPHHLSRNPALLPTGPRNLDIYFDPERTSHLRAHNDIRRHRSGRYGINNRNGSCTGRRARRHALEYTNEETGEDPGIWTAVIRIHCLSHHHGQNTLHQQIRRHGEPTM